jgi:hypothetical protein
MIHAKMWARSATPAPDAGEGRKAAEELAAHDSRLASIDHRLAMLTWQVGALAVVRLVSHVREADILDVGLDQLLRVIHGPLYLTSHEPASAGCGQKSST